MCDNAARIVGKAGKRQPSWFKDNESLLLSLFEKRRMLHDKSLDTRFEHDRKRFAKIRQIV